MKKGSTNPIPSMTVGIDLGDRYSRTCLLDREGEVVETGRIPTTRVGLTRRFGSLSPCRIAIEAGAQSRWVAQLLRDLGHEVLVANPRKVRAIYENDSKSDVVDAEMLARFARFDAKLLRTVTQRSQDRQVHLAVVRARAAAVEARSRLINHVRGVCKASGERLPACYGPAFHHRAQDRVPQSLRPALDPILQTILALTQAIRDYDAQIRSLVDATITEAQPLATVPGVGPLTALAFVLTLDDPYRFPKSRSVGAFLGLRPRRDQSGDTDKQLPITKAGDVYLRSLLVNCAQYILGPFGADSRLRRWGFTLAARGGKNAKKRAVVAVARKLTLILHHLWITGEPYQPFPQTLHPRRPAVIA